MQRTYKQQLILIISAVIIIEFIILKSTSVTEQNESVRYELNKSAIQRRSFYRNNAIVGEYFYHGQSCEGMFFNYTNFPNQTLKTMLIRGENKSSTLLYSFAAYLDTRFDPSVVQITGMMDKDRKKLIGSIECILWFNGLDFPISSNGSGTIIWEYYPKWNAFMVSCPLPQDVVQIPKYVGLTKATCTYPDNILTITAGTAVQYKTNKVGICTKVIYDNPDPTRLVEWIELNRQLGADRIYMYDANVKGKAQQVLSYYNSMGYVKVNQHHFLQDFAKTVLNKSFPTLYYTQDWEMEMLSMNDCLLTAPEKFVVNIDIDEILHPSLHGNFSGFVTNFAMKHPEVGSFVFHTGVFSDDIKLNFTNSSAIPNYLHTLIHNVRTRIDWESPKSIVNTNVCMAMGHHMCFHLLDGDMMTQTRLDIANTYGYIRHYRKQCRLVGEPDKCNRLMKTLQVDDGLLHLKDKLVSNIYPKLKSLNLI